MVEPVPNAALMNDRPADRDLLQFNPYTDTLLDIIRDPATTGPLVIGLFGTWGSGKTSLMSFIRDGLAKDREYRFRHVWFDAWKYEKEDTLWRTLLLRVVDSLRERRFQDGKEVETTPPELKRDLDRLEQRLYRDVEWEEKGGLEVDWSKLVAGAAAGAIKLSFAFLPGLATLTEAVQAARGSVGTGADADTLIQAFRRDIIEHHQAQLRSIEQFQKEFGALVEKHIIAKKQKLVVFVDDLDRCMPEKAIEVLEAIKLFLDVKGCIFLLGLDQEVVARGIKVRYRGFATEQEEGVPIDGGAYLEKIIQLPFRLPKIEATRMQPFVAELFRQSVHATDPRCADVFAVGLEANPRKVKRALNVFLFISRLADKRGLNIKPVRLAKIVVIYHSHARVYEELRSNPIKLRDLENYFRRVSQKVRESERGLVKTDVLDSAEHGARDAEPPPLELGSSRADLESVLTLFLDDADACFSAIDYDELNSYFTLTRGTIAETPAVSAQAPNVVRAGFRSLAFPLPTLVRIPAGEFSMGTSDDEIEQLLQMKETYEWAQEWKEKGYFKAEQPQHCVKLDEFQIGKYPVTNAEYRAFVQEAQHQPPRHWSGSADFSEELAAHPVVNVSWDDAVMYCEWLTQKLHEAGRMREDELIRLPTEAEWEKAAGWNEGKPGVAPPEHRLWPWGNEWLASRCNSSEGGIKNTTPVGKYSPVGDSFYGVADMAGNVWEWCADWYAEDYDAQSAFGANPSAPNRADVSSAISRVLRGGSWNFDQNMARCAYRLRSNPNHRFNNFGFRVAASSLPFDRSTF